MQRKLLNDLDLLSSEILPNEVPGYWENLSFFGWQLPTVEFYSHKTGPHCCFSNFYKHEHFNFTVPESCGRAELIATGRSSTVACAFSEKAIMLCKAAAMGDYASYDEIVHSSSPAHTKKCGRRIRHWDQYKWNQIVVEVAVQSVLQKFCALPKLAKVLLNTGDRLIAEMSSTDTNWGTGLEMGHPDGSRPAYWKGKNILGYALIVTRAELRCMQFNINPTQDTAAQNAAPATSALLSQLDQNEEQGFPSWAAALIARVDATETRLTLVESENKKLRKDVIYLRQQLNGKMQQLNGKARLGFLTSMPQGLLSACFQAWSFAVDMRRTGRSRHLRE